MARWKKENPSVNTEAMRRYLSDPEKGEERRSKSAEYAKEWRKKNPELRDAIQKRSYNKIRIECFTHYGNGKVECRCCGEAELKFLHLDHVNGDGANQRKLWKEATKKLVFGGTDFYYWLKKNNFPDLKLQILCANCNLGKRTNKYCPHELRRGTDMNGNVIPEDELLKPFVPLTRRARGEAIREAEALGTTTEALKAKRWRAKQRLLHPLIPQPQTTHCKNGHAYADGNLFIWTAPNGNIHRQCRQCKRDYKQRVKQNI